MRSLDPYDLYQLLRRGKPLKDIAALLSRDAFFEFLSIFDHEIFLESSRRHFDAVAPLYLAEVAKTKHMMQSLQWQMQVLPDIIHKDVHVRSDRILHISDFGAGVGAVSSWPLFATLLAEPSVILNPDRIRTTFYDISDDMKYLTKRDLSLSHYPPQITELFGDRCPHILELVKKAKYQDYDVASRDEVPPQYGGYPPKQHFIICSFVLHHLGVASKKAALRRMASHLRDDGFLILVDEYRTKEQYSEYLRELTQLAEEHRRDLPYGLECFVNNDWFVRTLREDGINLHTWSTIVSTDPASRLVGILASPRQRKH